jgi:hypothetical protein
MTKDDLIRVHNRHAASWQAMALVYGLLVGTLLLSASAIS